MTAARFVPPLVRAMWLVLAFGCGGSATGSGQADASSATNGGGETTVDGSSDGPSVEAANGADVNPDSGVNGCSETDFCACTNFCVSTCRCGAGGCPFTQSCEGAVCPNSCPSGKACAFENLNVFMCSPLCTPDGINGQGSCPAGMTCQTVCT
jgi:hypothetical protein